MEVFNNIISPRVPRVMIHYPWISKLQPNTVCIWAQGVVFKFQKILRPLLRCKRNTAHIFEICEVGDGQKTIQGNLKHAWRLNFEHFLQHNSQAV